MTKRSVASLALTAALALGGLAFASVDASAQFAGKGSSTPVPGGGTLGGANDDGFKVFLAQTDCRQTAVALFAHCPQTPPPVRIIKVNGERCLDVDHPRSVSPWGQVIINQRKTKIRYCDDLHTMQ